MKKVFIFLIMLFAAHASIGIAAQWPMTFHDVMGNKITLKKSPERIVLASGFDLVALSFIDKNPLRKLVGWGEELKKFDTATYQRYRQTFPSLATLPAIGSGSGDELSMEMLLSLSPDIVIFERWQAARSEMLIKQLKATGTQVVFIDFFDEPLKNGEQSLRLLGMLFDHPENAEALIAYNQEKLSQLKRRLKDAEQKATIKQPNVLIHAYPGMWEGYWSVGTKGLGEYVEMFKGNNIAKSAFANKAGGPLNLETILTQGVDVYIATGHSGIDANNSLPLGTGISHDIALRQLTFLKDQKVIQSLNAVKNQQMHGLWNYIMGSPMSIVAAELIAKWLHPDIFADISPQETWDHLQKTFLPLTLEGTFWIDLKP